MRKIVIHNKLYKNMNKEIIFFCLLAMMAQKGILKDLDPPQLTYEKH